MNDRRSEPCDVTTVAVFCAPTDAGAAEGLMRRSAEALVAVDGVDFLYDKDRAIFERDDLSAPEWAERPIFLSDEASNYALLLHHFWRPGAAYHYLALSPDSDVPRDELESQWRRLTGHMRRLLSVLRPDVALGFAQPPSAEADPVDYGRICTDRPKLVLLPWNYFDANGVEEATRRLLGAAAGICVTDLDDGQLVAVVAVPGEAPDPQFLAIVDAAPAISYVDPLIAESGK
jgi:hypothetical protein